LPPFPKSTGCVLTLPKRSRTTWPRGRLRGRRDVSLSSSRPSAQSSSMPIRRKSSGRFATLPPSSRS
ncbi:Unknown protein, partial [Striga hermonthica]